MDIGRAAPIGVSAGHATPNNRVEESVNLFDADAPALHHIHEYKKTDNPVSLAKLINLDLSFAQIGTYSMIAKMVLSHFIPDAIAKDPSKNSFLKIVDDVLKKVRQLCQYSIHAQPGLSIRKPDDIASDLVHNLEAAALGREVYNYNAFLGPWISVMKIFFPYSDKPLLGLIPRMIQFADNTIGKLTNMFWNIRRTTKSLIPYDGEIRSDALDRKQNDVRRMMSYLVDRYIEYPLHALKAKLFRQSAESTESSFSRAILAHSAGDMKKLMKEAFFDYINNIKAMFTSTYKDPSNPDKRKVLGSEEPENNSLYVRSKILSQVLGLFAGGFGSILNGAGIAYNFVGSFFNNKNLITKSDKFTDYANALMSLVYVTGEVPANINEFFKKLRGRSESLLPQRLDPRNLLVSGIGYLGMFNRMKILPGIKHIFEGIGLKHYLDKFDKYLQHAFLLFFSYNRLVVHDDERQEALVKSSSREREDARKHENLWKYVTLPFRVLFMDPQVTYLEQHKDLTEIYQGYYKK